MAHAKQYMCVDLVDGHDSGPFAEPNDAAAVLHAVAQYRYERDYVALYRSNVWFGLRAPKFLALVPTAAPCSQ